MEVVLSTVIASGALVFTIISFIQELKMKRANAEFEQFMVVLDRVAGRYPDGRLMVDVQQISAIYQLLQFSKFKFISLPVLEHYMQLSNSNNEESSFEKAVKIVYEKLQ